MSSSGATSTAPQAYDLTGSDYCTSATGQASIALNSNVISNPGAEYPPGEATCRAGDVPTRSAGSSPDDD